MNLAPVVLFVYNRPEHTRKTIESLLKNALAEQTDLYIYSDGAKNKDAEPLVKEVRQFIKEISGFKNIFVVERDINFGLASNIIDGVTDVVNSAGKVIVLEDDLLTSSNFLCFMNEALDKYENEQSVYAVTGYSFADGGRVPESTYFLSITSSWSWATWRGKWSIFSRDSEILKRVISDESKIRDFNFDDSYDYVSMSKLQLDGKINSWAIFWYMSIFLKNGLTLFPAERLVRNIGYDGSGTHCGDGYIEQELVPFDYSLTDDVFEKKHIRDIVAHALRKKKNSLGGKIFEKIKSFFMYLAGTVKGFKAHSDNIGT